MSLPVVTPNIFAAQAGPIPLSELDADFSELAAALNDVGTYTQYFLDTSGAANTLTVAVPAPRTFAYVAGIGLTVQVANTTTIATPVVNVNALGAETIVNSDGTPLSIGALVAGQFIQLVYDGAQFRLQSTPAGVTSGIFTTQIQDTVIGGGNASAFYANSDQPAFAWNCTLGAADAKLWDIYANATQLIGRTLTDANGGPKNWFVVTRTGDVIDDITFGNPADGNTFTFAGGSATFQGSIGVDGNATFDNLLTAGGGQFEVTTTEILGLGPVAGALVDMTPDGGTFVATYTGMTGVVTATATWYRIGKKATVHFGAAAGVSNAATFTITGVPAAIRPATVTQFVPVSPTAIENGGATSAGPIDALITAASGTITLYYDVQAAGWTTTLAKGVNVGGFSITYLLS